MTDPQVAEILRLRAQLAEAQTIHDAAFAAGITHGCGLARADAIRRVAAWRESGPDRDMPRDQAEFDAILLGPEGLPPPSLTYETPHVR